MEILVLVNKWIQTDHQNQNKKKSKKRISSNNSNNNNQYLELLNIKRLIMKLLILNLISKVNKMQRKMKIWKTNFKIFWKVYKIISLKEKIKKLFSLNRIPNWLQVLILMMVRVIIITLNLKKQIKQKK
jgi:hypothetical protein